MAARRNNQAKRTGGGSGTPGWMWLLIGLVIGAVALLVVKKGDDGGFYTAKSEQQPRPNADATPLPRASEEDEAPAPKAVAKPPEPTPDAPPATQYQFYDALLAGKEVAISDADLAARARTEQQQAKPSAAATPAQKPVAAIPQPIDETPAAAAPAAASPAPKSTSTASVATSPASRDDSRYLLQAGAFAASGDAEATKAKIALLGLSARVESAEISGNTVYRVRMGPYGSASELSEAKQKLASGGLQALAIKAQ